MDAVITKNSPEVHHDDDHHDSQAEAEADAATENDEHDFIQVNTKTTAAAMNSNAIIGVLQQQQQQNEGEVDETKSAAINNKNSSKEEVVADGTTGSTAMTSVNDTTTSTAAGAMLPSLLVMEITSMNSFDSNVQQDDHISQIDAAPLSIGSNSDFHDINRSNSNTVTTTTAVTSARKEQLLLQARYDRTQWIHQVALPYRYYTDRKAGNSYGNDNHNHNQNGGTSAGSNRHCHATFHLPSVHKVIQHLYGQASPYDVEAHISHTMNQRKELEEQQLYTTTSTGNTDSQSEDVTSNMNTGTNTMTDHRNVYRMNGRQILEHEIQQLQLLQPEQDYEIDDTSTTVSTTTTINNATKSVVLLLLQYQKFIRTLEEPSTATIVQKLRSYLRQLYSSDGSNNNNDADDDVSVKITKFQSYIYSIYHSVRIHPAFLNMMTDDTTTFGDHNEQLLLLRRCYDSFVYGHSYSYFETLFLIRNGTKSTSDVQEKDLRFQRNVQFLSSFATPIHLDIHCFMSLVEKQQDTSTGTGGTSSNNYDTSTGEQRVKELLSKSMEVLQSIDTYYSPYEKLQRILVLYHEINIALKTATTTTKLPSADEILPTFIYVILLLASSSDEQSINLYYNLYYIEQLLATSPSNHSNCNNTTSISNNSSSHYLRGEAGYAYTNLYSAFQFIYDFDISATTNDDPSSMTTLASTPPSSLSISKESWCTAIELYKLKAQEKFDAIQTESTTSKDTLRIDTYEPDLFVNFDTSSALSLETSTFTVPTPMDVRQARLRGETIDINWAIQQHQHLLGLSSTTGNNATSIHQVAQRKSVFEQVEDKLPNGFQRSYNYLNVHTVDDLKYSDVQQLLHEYHMLVRTTETLLSDRAIQLTRERKLQRAQQEQELMGQQQQQQQQQQMLLLLQIDNDSLPSKLT